MQTRIFNASFALPALLVIFLGSMVGSPAMAAGSEDRLELALGIGHAERNGFEASTLAIRWHHAINQTWGFVLSLSSDEVNDLSSSNRHVEFGVRRTLWRSEDKQVYGLLGAGLVQYDRVEPDSCFIPGMEVCLPVVIDLGRDENRTFHLGIGWLWDFGDRAFFSSEFRYRYHPNASRVLGDESYEGTVGLGWRF